jgi:hypothetical protein
LTEQVHDHLEHDAELHDQFQHGSKTHFEVHTRQESEREQLRESQGEFLRWDNDDATGYATDDANGYATDEAADNITYDEANDDNAFVDLEYDPAAAQPVAHQNFLRESERTSRTGVSGPSFLGLTDDHIPEGNYEEREKDSHVWRNVALSILTAVVVLVGLQWRSIRDYGLAYLQDGSMQVNEREKEAHSNPPAVAADNTSRDLGLPPATAKTGATQTVESSPNANRVLPVHQAANSPEPRQSAPASPSAASQQPPAMSAPVADVPEDVSEDVPTQEPPAANPSAENPRAYTPSARRDSRAATAPGADEMNRAARASDAEARAAWLWRAVGKGNQQAPVELARMYEQGTGVVRSCDQAQVLLRAAAAKGNEQARLSLQQIRMRGGCSTR